MDVNAIRNAYGKARISDRQVSEVIGLAHGIIADGQVNQLEAEYLLKWLTANRQAVDNPLISELYFRVEEYFNDGLLDEDESAELLELLTALSGGDYELGELQKSTTLPFCDPVPALSFLGMRYCFTGTFLFGKRRECELEVTNRAGLVGSLTKKTDVLVIGEYATDSWANSSFGRKIEKAVAYRNERLPISIVSEATWADAINNY